jgi:hypothetical protein
MIWKAALEVAEQRGMVDEQVWRHALTLFYRGCGLMLSVSRLGDCKRRTLTATFRTLINCHDLERSTGGGRAARDGR